MNTSKIVAGISSMVAILALAVAWRESVIAQTFARQATDAQQQNTQLSRQLGAAKASQEQAVQLIARLSSRKGQPQPAAPNRNAKAVHLADIVKDHPEYAELHTKDVRHRIIYQYGASLLALNLPPEQLAKVKDLLVERQLSAADAIEAAQANGLTPNSPEWRSAIEEATVGPAQDLNSILQTYGNTSLTEFELVNSTRVSSGVNLGAEITDAGLPLTDAQAQAIAQASADASYRSPNAQHPPNYNTPDPTTGLTPKQTQMINQVAPALSPAQLEIYKAALSEMMQREAIENQYGRNPATGMLP